MKSTSEIKAILQAASIEELPEFIKEYSEDGRAGVRKLAQTAARRLEELKRSEERRVGKECRL